MFRNSEVETLTFALFRNVTAVILVLALVGQSVLLFRNVIYEKFVVQEMWEKLGINITQTRPILYYVSSIYSE